MRPAFRLVARPPQGLALTLFWACCAVMRPERAAAFGGHLGRALGPRSRRHRRLRNNLAIALPRATDNQLDVCAQGVWGSFGATLAEYAHFRTIAGRSLGLLVDLMVKNGERVPFCGRDTTTTLVPARLALKVGCPLVPVRVERVRPAHLRVTVYDPVSPHDGIATDLQARRMMARINALFESWIVARP